MLLENQHIVPLYEFKELIKFLVFLQYKSSFGDSINFKNIVEEELQYDV